MNKYQISYGLVWLKQYSRSYTVMEAGYTMGERVERGKGRREREIGLKRQLDSLCIGRITLTRARLSHLQLESNVTNSTTICQCSQVRNIANHSYFGRFEEG